MGILPITSLLQPALEIEVAGTVDRERIAVELVNEDSIVTIGRKLVRDQLGVLPDADDVGKENDGTLLVDVLSRWLCDVDVC